MTRSLGGRVHRWRCQQLGHSTIAVIMDLYSHLMDGMENLAAEKICWAFAVAQRGKEV